MDNFLSLTLRDKELFNYFCSNSDFKSYEYTFASLYIWRNLCNTKYSLIDDSLIVWKHEDCVGNFFMVPYCYNKLKLNTLITRLLNLSYYFENIDWTNDNVLDVLSISDDDITTYPKCSTSIYLFGDVETSFIEDLKNYTNFEYEIEDNRNDFEYVYNTSDLIHLSGKKYHTKKNHCNDFEKKYNYEIKEINSPSIINDCLTLLEVWQQRNTKVLCCKELSFERNVIAETLKNLVFLNLKSIAVYVDNKLIGFSIGEINGDTAIIHFERCDVNYKGIYSFINREFLKKDFSNTVFVNRQEDCGDAGLRKSKTSYHPVQMIKKSLVKISS